MESDFNVGDRVYYLETGKEDTGTVVGFDEPMPGERGTAHVKIPLPKVEWDNGDETDAYFPGQLKKL